MDWHELEKMKVDDLRELAKEKTALEGVTALHKDELVEALANALNIEKPHRVVDAADKIEVKKQIRLLKQSRDQALQSRDMEAFRKARLKIRKLKRHLRREAHLTH